MSEPDDIEAVAGEYVLGTLTALERAEVALRRQSETALDRAIRRWERDFGPLAEAVPSMAPPPGLLARIETRLDREAGAATRGSGENVVTLRRRVGWWRSIAVASSALAASLLLVVVWQICSARRGKLGWSPCCRAIPPSRPFSSPSTCRSAG